MTGNAVIVALIFGFNSGWFACYFMVARHSGAVAESPPTSAEVSKRGQEGAAEEGER